MRLGLWRQGFWQNEKDEQGVGRCQRAGKIKRRGKGDFAQDPAEQWSTDKAEPPPKVLICDKSECCSG
jgi:hypothetical protein